MNACKVAAKRRGKNGGSTTALEDLNIKLYSYCSHLQGLVNFEPYPPTPPPHANMFMLKGWISLCVLQCHEILVGWVGMQSVPCGSVGVLGGGKVPSQAL